MSNAKLVALAASDCAALAARIRDALGGRSGPTEADHIAVQLLELVGLVEWSLPSEHSNQKELDRARFYIDNRELVEALSCIDATIEGVQARVCSRR